MSPNDPNTLSFPVEFDLPGQPARNAELKGSGWLEFDPRSHGIVFRGTPRQTVPGALQEIRFSDAEIANVATRGRMITFLAERARGAGARPPRSEFVFFAADADTARSIAGYLPERRDVEFVERGEFARKLEAVFPDRPALGWATNVLVALNVGAFVVFALFLGAGWLEVKDLSPYVRYGANNGAATTDGQWWRLITSMFLHYGILHLAFNLWALHAAGKLLERLLGSRLFLVVYLGAGLAGGIASIAWHGDRTWSAGASGAVFGVYAALLGYMLRQKHTVPPTVFRGMMKSSLSFAGYNLLFGLAQARIDHAAHLGGAAGGLVLGALVALPLDPAIRQARTAGRLIAGIAAVGTLLALGIAFTPRFEYVVADEIAFRRAISPLRERETELLEANASALPKLATPDARAAHAAWIERELVPHYEGMAADLNALSLEPGRTTAKRRELIARYVELRLRAYRNLAANLRASAPDTLRQFEGDEAAAAKVIESMRSQ